MTKKYIAALSEDPKKFHLITMQASCHSITILLLRQRIFKEVLVTSSHACKDENSVMLADRGAYAFPILHEIKTKFHSTINCSGKIGGRIHIPAAYPITFISIHHSQNKV
ncbi:hypothetical protein BIV60_13060 [Bacillus sp. MUM 116]|nr:hypothetical protein BIV60_13060 [Bacillus sp. MUM 116]